jgi:hypothetical protein
MVRRFVATIALGVICGSATPGGQSPAKAGASNPFVVVPPSERLEIDGSKNPELIPEWFVWETFFRQLHRAGTVPSALGLRVSEERLLKMQLEQFSKSIEQCQKEIEKLRPQIGMASNQDVNDKQRAIQLECRRRSLDIRDRLLSGVRPEASDAMVRWVENLKTGIEISVPKRELAHFRQPR